MTEILKFALSLLPVILFLIGLIVLDSFKLVKLRNVLLTIAVPFGMVREGLLQLLNAAPDKETVARIEGILEGALGDIPADASVVRVLRTGRTLYALVHVVVDPSTTLTVPDLDTLRENVATRLTEAEPTLTADLVFTTDSRWATP